MSPVCFRSSTILGFAIGLGCSLFSAFSSNVSAQDRLVLLNGQTVPAVISKITADGAITGGSVPETLDVDGLRSITRPDPTIRPATGGAIVDLAGGGVLHATGITIAEEQCKVTWAFGDDLTLSIDAVRSIRFDAKRVVEGFQSAFDKPSAEFDRIFIDHEDKIQKLTGLIEELSADQVVFEWKGQQLNQPRKRIYGIVLAQLGGGEGPSSNATVFLRDGSMLPGNIASLTDGVLKLKLSRVTSVNLPWDAVAKVNIRSSRLAYLSDLKPVDESQQTIVTLNRGWQRDRSVLGRRLTLRDNKGTTEQTFDKGLGTHSHSKLVFDVGKRFDWFAATIGIDAETNGRGDCVLKVLADGKEIYAQQVKGSDSPRDIKLPITDAQRLTLVVETGEDLDLADHADWCDARLIRDSRK